MTIRRTSLIAFAVVAIGCWVVVAVLRNGQDPTTEVFSNKSVIESSSAGVVMADLIAPAGPAGNPAGPASEPLSVSPVAPKVEAREVQAILPYVEVIPDDWRDFQPERIFIAPYPDLAIDFERVAVREDQGRVIWTGRNSEQSASLITVATADQWHAVLTVPGANVFEFHVSGDSASVMELLLEREICGTDAPMFQAGAKLDFHPEVRLDDAPRAPADELNDVYVVDVLFFYDAATLADAHGNPEFIENRMMLQIEASNEALANSDVLNFVWRYIGAFQIPHYEPTRETLFDIEMFRDLETDVGRFAYEKSVLLGADQSVLIVAGDRDSAGRAYMPGHHALVLWNMSYFVLAHELGHNFGCHHDRDAEDIPDNDGNFNYGHRFRAGGRPYGTIMAYAPWRIPHFSNPEVRFYGGIGGQWYRNGILTGVPEDEPRAANNARILREAAPAMAAHRSPLTVPVITAQPQSITLQRGQSFTLSVTAEGGDLHYQWMRENVDIAGATQPVFFRSNASAADSGTYSVDVFNFAGMTTSHPATVTVVNPPSQSSSSSGQSGGGSGGGATSAVFVLAGLLLVGARMIHRRRAFGEAPEAAD